jgi:menaquinone-dependent protoporphyrinogen oxidase
MRVMVCAATKHGATIEIAERIGETLRDRLRAHGKAVDVVVCRAETSTDLTGFDAYVLGSAVYMGHWLEPMRELLRRYEPALHARPVWLFSSGPIGDPPKPDEQPVDAGSAVMTARAVQHRVFSGKLNHDRLGLGERAMVAALRAPYGDYRNWAAIDTWAASIADALST